ncbi:MAG: bacillithiol biosynthesis deacetylase BshB1 [Nitrospinota bacterium]
MVDILAVGAHPDDVEIGAGGIIAAVVRNGKSAAILDLTNGEPTPKGTPETRAKEAEKARSLLNAQTRITLDLKNRELMDTVEARVKVAEVYRQLKPEVLLLPYWEDAHPDHIQASHLSQAARFVAKYTKTSMKGEPYYPTKVFYYFCTHLKKDLQAPLVFDISETFDIKMEAIKAYRSQFHDVDPERADKVLRKLEATAIYYGSLINVRYGEPILNAENIGISSFDAFIK